MNSRWKGPTAREFMLWEEGIVDAENENSGQPDDASTLDGSSALVDRPDRNRVASLTDLIWKVLAAGSDTTSPEILTSLSRDIFVSIRRRVARNPSCPPAALAVLCEDADIQVRVASARNLGTPRQALIKLSVDENASVRFALATNYAAPDAILLALFLDSDPYVAERARSTLAA